jgi:hypothetical protein
MSRFISSNVSGKNHIEVLVVFLFQEIFDVIVVDFSGTGVESGYDD